MEKAFNLLLKLPPLVLCIIMLLLYLKNGFIAGLIFCFWIYIVNNNIKNLAKDSRTGTNIFLFRILFIVTVVLFIVNIFFYNEAKYVFETLGLGSLPTILIMYIPLLIIGIYLFSFSSQNILHNEENGLSPSNPDLLTFLEHIIFPIGIYFLQERIIKINKVKNL